MFVEAPRLACREESLAAGFEYLCSNLGARIVLSEHEAASQLAELDALFGEYETQFCDKLAKWVEAQRRRADLPARIALQPLPAHSYTEQHHRALVDSKVMYRGGPILHSKVVPLWGRLNHFRSPVLRGAYFFGDGRINDERALSEAR